MAKATQTTKTTTRKGRRKKTGSGSDYIQCNVCHGTGRIKNWRKKGKR